MMKIDRPYTIFDGTNVNLNLLNDVRLLYYSKTVNDNHRQPFYVRHSHRAQCKEYGFAPRINASQVGNDYSIVNFDNIEEENWDDSMFFMIPSGPSHCKDDSPCDDFRYRVAVHPQTHFPRVFQDFWKYADKLTMIGIDSLVNRELLSAPYGNCVNQWPVETIKIAKEKNLSFLLRNNYSLNECISSFRNFDVRCPSECVREEYSIGKTFTVDTRPGYVNEFFNLSVSQTELTYLEIVFLQLKYVQIGQQAMITSSQLMGTIGGLAGLFMGISLVSLVEMGELCLVLIIRLIRLCVLKGGSGGAGQESPQS